MNKEHEEVFGSIRRVSPSFDEVELELVLRRFGHVDLPLEAHRFAERALSSPTTTTNPVKAFEGWLGKAKPLRTTPTQGGLTEYEIERKVAKHRLVLSQAVEFTGPGYDNERPVFTDEELDEICQQRANQLRAGRR